MIFRPIAINPAVALLIAAAALVMLCLAWPVSALFLEQRAAIESAQTRLATVMERRIDIGTLEQRLSMLEAQPASKSGLLTAKSLASAPAELEQHLQSFAQRHGAHLMSMNRLPLSTPRNVPVVRAAVSVQLTGDRIGELIRDLEHGEPSLIIDGVKLRRLGSAAGPAGELVQMSLDVRAFVELPVGGQP